MREEGRAVDELHHQKKLRLRCHGYAALPLRRMRHVGRGACLRRLWPATF
jgi:hypothetical protein